METITTGVRADTTGLVNLLCSFTSVEASAPQVVSSLPPLDEFEVPVYNQVDQEQIPIVHVAQQRRVPEWFSERFCCYVAMIAVEITEVGFSFDRLMADDGPVSEPVSAIFTEANSAASAIPG